PGLGPGRGDHRPSAAGVGAWAHEAVAFRGPVARALHRRRLDGRRAFVVPLVPRAVRVHRDVDPLATHARRALGEANHRAVLRTPRRHDRARLRAHERSLAREALARGLRKVELARASYWPRALDRWPQDPQMEGAREGPPARSLPARSDRAPEDRKSVV